MVANFVCSFFVLVCFRRLSRSILAEVTTVEAATTVGPDSDSLHTQENILLQAVGPAGILQNPLPPSSDTPTPVVLGVPIAGD